MLRKNIGKIELILQLILSEFRLRIYFSSQIRLNIILLIALDDYILYLKIETYER